MLSDEEDQTEEFEFELLEHTPMNIYVQLKFSRPLEVSQGVMKDRIHVKMLKTLFMVEDLEGHFAAWQEGEKLANGLRTKEIILTTDPKDYKKLLSY
jgi:hypothetical protein